MRLCAGFVSFLVLFYKVFYSFKPIICYGYFLSDYVMVYFLCSLTSSLSSLFVRSDKVSDIVVFYIS